MKKGFYDHQIVFFSSDMSASEFTGMDGPESSTAPMPMDTTPSGLSPTERPPYRHPGHTIKAFEVLNVLRRWVRMINTAS